MPLTDRTTDTKFNALQSGGLCSRRSFLKTAGVGLGAVALPLDHLHAEKTALDGLTFVVVSDTHLGRRDNESAEKQWAKTAAEIADGPGEFVLHLGDVVDGGREAQYPVYLKIREQIKKPVHEIPGNHDPQPLFEKYIRKTVDTSVDYGWLRVLLLNNSRRDSHDGFLSDRQIAWIDAECASATKKGMFVLIAMHVPVHSNRHPDRGWYVKPDNGQKGFYDVLTKHRDRVPAVFHGHFHNGLRGWTDHAPVHEMTLPSALYNLDRKLEERNAPGYNLAEFRPGYTIVELKDGRMTLKYKPVGKDVAVSKTCEVSQIS